MNRDLQTNGQMEKWTDREMYRLTAGQIETDGQKFRGTKEQTDRHTDRQRDTVFCMNISLFVLFLYCMKIYLFF